MRAKEFLEDISRRNLLKGAGAMVAGVGTAQAKQPVVDPMDQLLQQKGLMPKQSSSENVSSLANQFADALEQEDEIAKIGSGKLDAATLHKQDRPGIDTRTTGPDATAQARSMAVTTNNFKSKSLPPVAQKIAQAPVVKKPKVEIKQSAGSVPWQDIAHYCKSKWNMTTAQVAGILANIKVESRFFANDEHMDSNGLPAGGLFSHNGPRLEQLKQKLGKNWKQNWQGQIDFALTEPDGARYIAKHYPSPEAASKAWTHKFERPANAKVQAAKRAPAATQYASNL
jgi:hypothetical protein